ncbi:hypothetical protein [Knoellia aerolata]|uniref:Uncharacterized protein n=1 Tax=Knoellia aerolata DSM 18566 TaxID=1385519 RepID=A0A0A0JSM1_9MICO|nr:hypothetical protein [Knoellia aerolata]KGN40425.1 hypothetical protein N801_08325 [Knoellia aerolata DSM 18566]
MREQGTGQIITISSQAATKAIPFIGGYAATDRTLLPHVVTPQAVADAVAEVIGSGEAEVGVLPRWPPRHC